MPRVTLVSDFGLSTDRQAEQALVQTNLPPYSQSTDAKNLVAAIRDSSRAVVPCNSTSPAACPR